MAQPIRQKSPTKLTKSNTRAPSKNDDVFQVLQEMFHGKVEPEVVHMILTEMDWKVDRAIDTLLTLCGEGSDAEKKKSRLQKLAHDILCKKNEKSEATNNSAPLRLPPTASNSFPSLPSRSYNISDITTDSNIPVTVSSRSQGIPKSVYHMTKSPDISDHAIASNSTYSAVGVERNKIISSSATESPLQRIRNVMASTYGTHPDSTQEVMDKGKIGGQKPINPLSVDDEVTMDNNLLSQSILSGALNLNSNRSVPEVSPLSPSKLYKPFGDSTKDTSSVHQDSYQTYMEKYWPDLSGKMWPQSSRDASPSHESNHNTGSGGSTNIFPGMYTDDGDRMPIVDSYPSGTLGSSGGNEFDKLKKKNIKRDINFPPTGVGNAQTSLLERLGLAEKNDKGQLKNLQKDPEEDLDLNFSIENLDDDSSSDGSILSHSGSAETMTTELKNMLGLSKEEKKEPTMLESAARELERLNALSPNAKEFVPRSLPVETSSKQVEIPPKFLTPKCALPTQHRNLPPYAMVQQHPNLRQVPMIQMTPRIPFSPQMVPVSIVGLRNVPPPPPSMNCLPPTSQIGPGIPPPNILCPPPIGPVSTPSPPILKYATVATSPSGYPSSAQQVQQYAAMATSPPAYPSLAQQAQQYAAAAAQQQLARLGQNKEPSSSPERFRSPDLNTQRVKEKIKNGVRLLIILRGLPGSGKSTLARELRGGGAIFSADDFFMNGEVYCYDQRKLTEAHDQCRRGALEAVQRGVTPVIIDNTNTQVWEMCPFVDIAKSVDPEYDIEILEPMTPWKFKAKTCSEKSDHGVPYESIKRMLDRYQKNVTVDMLITTKSRSRPTNAPTPAELDEPQTKKTKKSKEPKRANPVYNQDNSDGFWNDVGSIKMKNYFQPLMDAENETEPKSDEDRISQIDEDFPALKKEDKVDYRKANILPKLIPNIAPSSQNGDILKPQIEVTDKYRQVELRKELLNDKKEENMNKTSDNKSSEVISNDKTDRKGSNFIPMATGFGFQIKPQKSLSSLHKQIELISKQKTLVSSNMSASPVTVELEQNEEDAPEQKTSRTQSFEKSRADDKQFSEEIHELVDGLITEHVQDKTFSNNDLDQVHEELKAFLHIMPIDSQQREDAEELIAHKLSIFLQHVAKPDLNVQDNEDIQKLDVQFDTKMEKEKQTLFDNSNLTSSSDSGEFVDGFYITNLNDVDECVSLETEKLEQCQQSSETFGSNIDENGMSTSLELSLEKILNFMDEKPDDNCNNNCHALNILSDEPGIIENESKTPANTGDCKADNSKDQCNSGIESTFMDNTLKGHESFTLEHQDLTNKIENVNSVTVFNTENSLCLGFSDNNWKHTKKEETENQSDELKSDQLKNISDECLGENFWDLDNNDEIDYESNYWENGKVKPLAEFENKGKKSSCESDLKTASDNGIQRDESFSTVWNEPKSRRQRKKNNRDKRKGLQTTSNNKNGGTVECHLENNKLSDKHVVPNQELVCDKIEVNNDQMSHIEVSSNYQTAYHSSTFNQNASSGSNSETFSNHIVYSNLSPYSNQIPSSDLLNVPSSYKVKNVLKSELSDQSETTSESQLPHSILPSPVTENVNFNGMITTSSDMAAKLDGDQKIVHIDNTGVKKISKDDQVNNRKTCDIGNSSSNFACLDKSSFLITHYGSSSSISTVENTSSLIFSKKVKVELTIDSETVKSKLRNTSLKRNSEKVEENMEEVGESNNSDGATEKCSGKPYSGNLGYLMHDGSCQSEINDIAVTDISDLNALKNGQNNLNRYTCVIEHKLDVNEKAENTAVSTEIVSDIHVCSITPEDENTDLDILGSSLLDETVSQNVQIDIIECDDGNNSGEKSEIPPESTVNVIPGTKKKKKQNNKRKMAAKFPPEKFLDESVREAFLNNDWATQMPKLEGSAPVCSTSDEFAIEILKTKVHLMHSSTSITPIDLKVLSLVNNGNIDIFSQIDYPYKICIASEAGSSVKVEEVCNDTSVGNTSIPVVCHPDKSTMTDNLCVVGLEFLHSSFPNISERELRDILERCDGDVEWAVNILLDWKYNLHLNDEDSEKFVDVMFRSQNIPKSPVIHSSLRHKPSLCNISPLSLQDICYNVVINVHSAKLEEIEQQLISSSKKRLHRLETQLSYQSKQYSFSSFGDEVIEEDSEFTEAFLRELMNSAENRSLSSESHESSQVSLLDESIPISSAGLNTEDPSQFWNVEFDLGSRSKALCLENGNDSVNSESDFGPSDGDEEENEPQSDIIDQGMPESDSIGRNDITDARSRTDSFGEPTVLLPLKKEFIKALFSLFGPIEGLHTENEEDMSIPVTLDVAKLMYSCIRTAFRKGQVRVHSEQQLKEDEAYARQLQAEEDQIDHHDNRVTGPINSTPQSSSRRKQPVVGLSIDQSVNLSPKIPKVISLKEIMNEERSKEIEKKELVETLRQSGSFNALSTKLKQQKLFDQFPGIDQTVLDDIYQANCCNLEETVKAIQGSLACNTATPKTVMSKEAEHNYEKHLIDAAKQQSLQEMLDSYLHVPITVPKIIRDAQSVSNVDYEEFRGEANLHYRLRHECFQKAQEYHRKGMKQVSSFYSQQGHVHTQKIKEANMRASEKILASRHELLEKNSTLDLHGLHVDEAIAALERILPNKEYELQNNSFKNRHYLIVVTGKGSHSRGGISKLKPAVMNYLRRNEYKFSEIHEGAIRVNLKHRNIT